MLTVKFVRRYRLNLRQVVMAVELIVVEYIHNSLFRLDKDLVEKSE